MALKQRGGKRSAGETGAASTESSGSGVGSNKEKSKRTKDTKSSDPTYFIFAFFAFVGGLLGFFYLKYGPVLFLGQAWNDYKWTASEWRRFIDDNERTILLIGGPHRGGTTIIWEAIKAHPEIVGFGDRFDTGVDYSEGVLMQDVYPRFGVGLEFQNFGKGGRGGRMEGVGKYALNPDVHWTKENKREYLEDPSTLSRLLNRFAPHWDRNKKFGGSDGLMKAKVWVEKSPQNAVLSTFLEGVYNMPLKTDKTVSSGDVKLNKSKRRMATKFLYITRHPIANVYATDKFVRDSMGGNIDFEILLKNYIALHKYMKMDEKALESPAMWVRLEDFASDPSSVLKDIFSFLDVSADDKVVQNVLDRTVSIRSEPNENYITKWCREGIRKHGRFIQKYANDLRELDFGYDLDICK